MLLLPDSLTLCALTVVSQHVVFSVVSCRVSFVLVFFFCFGPSNCCRHHSFFVVSCRCLAGRFYLWHKTGNDLCKMADAQLI